jgi:hypothetical protein
VKQVVVLLALAFVVTLGVVVGTRMSSDAIAVLVGVIAGVAASIPTALLLMAVTRRRESEKEDRERQAHYTMGRAAPPVIVVTPGGGVQQQLPYGSPYGYAEPVAGLQPGQRRQFRVMGYDEEDEQVVEGEVEGRMW